jgi:hypothetical protein
MELEFLMVGDAARELNCSTDRVRQLERQGRLPAFRTLSGRRLFLRDHVRRLAKERARRLVAGRGGCPGQKPHLARVGRKLPDVPMNRDGKLSAALMSPVGERA